MTRSKFQLAAALAIGSLVMEPGIAMARSETVLHTFQWNSDGGFPFAGLAADPKGNLFGVAYLGGNTGGVCCGTVYEISAGNKKNWQYNVIYTFQGPVSDGEAPSGGLVADAAGDLYGTAQQGGQGLECGIVYELSPKPHGKWKETILHEFNRSFSGNHRDGCTPVAGLVFDQAGNLYGTTEDGGGRQKGVFCDGEAGYYCGTVFRLAPADGGWKETVIHRFPDGASDGYNPYGRLVFDHAGNLWGTTLAGPGTQSAGAAFELTPNDNGTWTEATVFDFSNDGTGLSPYGGLTIDSGGNLYGTAFSGGNGAGVVFELTPQLGGQPVETVIHEFAACTDTNCPDGLSPFGGLAIDSAGNLYGTTVQGGGAGAFCNPPNSNLQVGCGVLFKLAPAGGGVWNYSILYAFPGSTQGAYLTDDRPYVDSSGNVFGTTFTGGNVGQDSPCPMEVFDEPGCGVVFRIKP